MHPTHPDLLLPERPSIGQTCVRHGDPGIPLGCGLMFSAPLHPRTFRVGRIVRFFRPGCALGRQDPGCITGRPSARWIISTVTSEHSKTDEDAISVRPRRASAQSDAPPVAVPVACEVLPISGVGSGPMGPPANASVVNKPTDSCAVASAVFGITAIVPIVFQVAGVVLGVAGLVRIRRARRAGRAIRGTGWAVAGLLASGFALLGWIAVAVAFSLVGSSLAGSVSELQGLTDSLP